MFAFMFFLYYNVFMKDLHIHSIFSDGDFDIPTILKEIKAKGITEFAICDHDTIEGSKQMCETLKKEKEHLVFHSGVELTSRLNFQQGFNMHLLAYDFPYESPYVLRLIDKISKLRAQKIPRMTKLVQETYNVKISDDEINAMLKTTNSFGKPHIFKILKTHIDCNRKDFFKIMDTLHENDLKLDAKEVIENIHNAGGKVVLAHPIEIVEEYNLDLMQLEKIIEQLAKIGLDGIETYHSSHTIEQANQYSNLAKKYKLFETSGSDFHGPTVKPHVKIGVCKKDN